MTTYDSTVTYDALATYSGDAIQVPFVELDGLPLVGVDADGCEWIVEEVNGWDSPDLRQGTTPRPQADGVFWSEFFHGARAIEVTGDVLCPTRDLATAVRYRLAAAADLLRSEGLLVVVEDDLVGRCCSVRQWAPPKITQLDRAVRYSLAFIAADPRKLSIVEHATVLAANSRAALVNAGLRSTDALLEITGPAVNPTVRNETTGEALPFAVTLAEGDILSIDTDNRTATVGGVSVRASLAAGYRWWKLPPGASRIAFAASGASPTTTATVRWRDAWI